MKSKTDISGTKLQNEVALKDLNFWLKHTKEHLCDGIPAVTTFDELLKLPVAQIGYILSKVLQIIRRDRKLGGTRLANCTLKNKAESWQRIIRNAWLEEDSIKVLFEENYVPRKFQMYEDPRLAGFKRTLDEEMRISASEGLSSGRVKATRSSVKPSHLKKIMQLYNTSNPRDMELCFGVTLMLQLGNRGGEELRRMHWGQFSKKFDDENGKYFYFDPMAQGSFKNYTGGLKDWNKKRAGVEVFNNESVDDCFNPYRVFETYIGMLPKDWTVPSKGNPIFLTPLSAVKNGVGFSAVPRGRNILAKFFQRAMDRIGVSGKFTNQQIRSTTITAALETGMHDNEIRAITGHRSESGLDSYKVPSMAWKRQSRHRMINSVVAGGNSYFSGLQDIKYKEPLMEAPALKREAPEHGSLAILDTQVCESKVMRASEVSVSRKCEPHFEGLPALENKSNEMHEEWPESKWPYLPDCDSTPGTICSQESKLYDIKPREVPRFGRRRVMNKRERDCARIGIVERNQDLFRMFMEHQNMMMPRQSHNDMAQFEQIYTKEEVSGSQDVFQKKQAKKRFRLASELGLSL